MEEKGRTDDYIRVGHETCLYSWFFGGLEGLLHGLDGCLEGSTYPVGLDLVQGHSSDFFTSGHSDRIRNLRFQWLQRKGAGLGKTRPRLDRGGNRFSEKDTRKKAPGVRRLRSPARPVPPSREAIHA